MKSMYRVALALAVAAGLAQPLFAEEGVKSLPTLLIKGDVVSLDVSDPAATLLKVKDRYGFETPIYVTGETKVTQGQAPTTIGNLSAGTPVEVEYNFDINTAKRHAVTVNVTSIAAGSTPAPAPAAPVVPAPEAPQVEAPAAPVPPVEPEAAAPTPAPEAVQPPADAPAPESPAAPQ